MIKLPKLLNHRELEYENIDTTITILQGKGIVGEDCLEQNSLYKYSIIVKSPEAKLYMCEKNPAHTDLYSFPIFPILLKGYHLKEYSKCN